MKMTHHTVLAAGLLAGFATLAMGMGGNDGSRTRNVRENDRASEALMSAPLTNMNGSATGGVWRSGAEPSDRPAQLAQNIGSDWTPGIGSRSMNVGGVTGSLGGASAPVPFATTGSVGSAGGPGGGGTNDGLGGGIRDVFEPDAGSSGNGTPQGPAPDVRPGTQTEGGAGTGASSTMGGGFGTGTGTGSGGAGGTGSGMGTGAKGTGSGL